MILLPVQKILLYFIVCSLGMSLSNAQQWDDTKIARQIEVYKKDIRGPYKDIRWFCTDGSIRAPKDPCPENIGPGLQHARYKDDVVALGKNTHVFLGQILSYTDKEDFWDKANGHSRLIQYQIDRYLRTIDNGWIHEKGQFYRGAIQAEDEEAWGIAFYKWLLSKDEAIEENYFLIRQSLRDIPHSGDDNLAQLMRSQSKVISDLHPPFMDLRVKIHGQPEYSDIAKVKSFQELNSNALSGEINKKFDELVGTMANFFKPIDIGQLNQKSPLLKTTPIGPTLEKYIENNIAAQITSEFIQESASLLLQIRTEITNEKRPLARLQLLDLSLKLEEILFKQAPKWQPNQLGGLLEKICYLGMASTGAGYLEIWEWEEIMNTLNKANTKQLTLADLNLVLETARGTVEWSSATVKATYQKDVASYTGFEPKAYGFIDDRIRGSIALYLGKSVGELGDFIAKESALTNKVFDIPNQSTVRGLNPGYAMGELVVVSGSPDEVEVSTDKIYIFKRAPADLKPVAGIATVAEGNLVSHVQLLARNLGIPNAALSDENLQSLRKYEGQMVFYAVSNKGNVLLKPATKMSEKERQLFLKKERSTDKIEVPVSKIKLAETNILNLRDVDADDSGELCGPKAANLGQLKKMFPENVVDGLVIPFGIFKDHMNQAMPGQSASYWQFLNNMFVEAEAMRGKNIPEAEVENYQLRQLEILREAIKKMPLKTDFTARLEEDFKSILGHPLGDVPVFLRSDTNMEDLKDFTGAGLNLTLFNVVEKEKILNGIKEVWASPYTERSFKWRQKYLLNPENVFPSILVIPSVNVDYSGVLITKGINSGNEKDLTIAFSRGAGGAVDGQSAETYTLKDDGGYQLLAPARETYFNSLPETGGTSKEMATFEKSILNEQNIQAIRKLAETIRTVLPRETKSDYNGSYDVELGFQNNKLWLFQIRPFVENKKALSSDYLKSITPKINSKKEIALSTPL